ncbi:CPBP family intramembrane glutamic endopeptidase [Gammaproteobacteria bacterium AB-CW1]|uniref:CPBP family intramembrane glutamic endopeptidase n=1 Tax=Natronospira elongata TaxID=3110268 RepID=A0AAP6JED7_9GAMM|nr:CPBP family intramembrane glutamic endopeptidase [Gammaproteobacteria bacterium AB-CW1]
MGFRHPVQVLHGVSAYCLMLVLSLGLLWLAQWFGGLPAAFARVGAMQVACLLTIALVVGTGRLAIAPTLGLARCSWSSLVAALLLGGGLMVLVAATLARLYYLGEAEDHARAVDEVLGEARVQLGGLTLALMVVAFAPLSEELLFRGLILRGMLDRFPPWAAVLVTTVLFAMLHAHPVHSLVTGVLGLACAIVVIRQGSIWPAVIMHAAWNGSAMLMDETGVPGVLPLWTIAPALVMIGGGILLMGRR